jgi:hypothetical protein
MCEKFGKVEYVLNGLQGHGKTMKIQLDDVEKEGSNVYIYTGVQSVFHDSKKDWDFVETTYCRVETCLEHVHRLVMKARLVALEKKECDGLYSKSHKMNNEILGTTMCLENGIKQHSFLQCYAKNGKRSKFIHSTPTPIKHFRSRTTKPLNLAILPCLVCNHAFHLCDIVVASYGCTYHFWCIGFQVQMS